MRFKNSTLPTRWLGKQLSLLLFFSFAVFQSGFGQCSMSCSDNIQISLNQKCQAEVTYRMILRDPDNPYLCTPNGPSAYKVVVMEDDGTPIPTSPIITCEYVGRTLKVKVKHWYSGNSCWSTVLVEDKLPPMLNCTPIELWCNQNGAPESEGGMAIMPSMIDVCAETCQNLTLNYTDKEIIYTCDDASFNEGIAARIERTWTACDDLGNCTTCIQPITFRFPSISEIDFPTSLIGDDALSCGECDPADLNCTGQPSLHHGSLENSLCQINTNYQDSITTECEGTYTIERTWAIQNTCTDETLHYTQLIEIVDQTPPVIVCVNGNTAVVAQTDPTPFSCAASIIVPAALITDNCASEENISVITKIYKVEELTGTKTLIERREDANGGFALELEFGLYEIYYQATDACGNVSNNLENACKIEIKDEVAPTPVCNALTKLTLDADGNGIIFAKSFDSGSYDNCCLDTFEVRRMDDEDGEFMEYVEFSCEDSETGNPLLVVLRVHDCNGNFADCMVEVLIDDKSPPKIIECPQSMTVSCSENLSLEDIQTNLLTEPLAEDLCGSITSILGLKHDYRNDCGIGAVIFEWQVFDAVGNVSICEQLISFIDDTPVTVTFPGDYTKFACSGSDILVPAITGVPVVEGKDCEEFEVLYTDSPIEGDTSCTSFFRTWVVTNLCAGADGVATYEHVQMISIEDVDSPVIDCKGEFFDICLDGGVCARSFEVPGVSFADCSSEVKVRAEWIFTPDAICIGEVETGMVEEAENGFITPEFGPGQLWINFYAIDGCGNESVCNRDYTITDCEAPEVLCLPGLTLNLDITGNIEIWANDFNQEITDNCDECPDKEFIFSFSQDTSETSRAYDCEDLGLKSAQIWVTDSYGNQDLCTVTFIIKGADICNDLGLDTTAVEPEDMAGVVGRIYKESGQAVEGVIVTAENHKEEMMDRNLTDDNGAYAFEFRRSTNIIVNPSKNDDILNGVSTFDILQLRKHILGFATLDSPYKMVAADINHSNSVTTADIVALRRVILQVDENFPNNTSWRFIKAEHNFEDSNNPFVGEMPENVTIPELREEMQIDFVAIKVGDLNGNAVGAQLLNRNADARNANSINLTLTEKYLQRGAIETITFTVEQADIQGFQMTLNFDPSVIEILEIPTTNLVSEANFGTRFLNKGALTMSWDALENNEEKLRFKLKIRANSALSVGELFTINSKITAAEAYDSKGAIYNIKLATSDIKYDYELLQNKPNPFNHQTAIHFTLPVKSQGKLTVFDITGQTLKSISQTFEKGKNKLIINDLQQVGVLYYQLETDFGIKMKKMIRVE